MAALHELGRLTSHGAWLRSRAAWLSDRLAAGDLPERGWSVGDALPGPAQITAPTTPLRPHAPVTTAGPAARGGAGGLLLTGGAILLVLAGIAFVGFAWDLLGPVGQLLTLYAVGVLLIAAGVRLHPRLPGTGTTLAVVGVLLVAVSTVASRTLGAELLGETGALALSTAAGAALAGLGVWLSHRLRAVGELAAVVGAALALGLLALAPADEALRLGDHWAWWAAIVLLLGGVVLVTLGHGLEVRTWPWLAAPVLVLGSLATAGYVTSVLDAPGRDTRTLWSGAVAALLVLGLGQLLLVRALPWRPAAPVWSAAVVVLVAAAVAFTAGVVDPASRPLATVMMALVAGVVLLARLLVPSRAPTTAVHLLALAAAGSAVGLGLAPWTEGWATGRGVAAGLIVGLLLVVVGALDRADRPGLLGVSALVTGAAALGSWLLAVTSDAPWAVGDNRLDVAAALALVAVAGWAEAARRRLPSWSVWLSAAPAAGAVALVLAERPADAPYSPEAYGTCLAAVAAVAGALSWWLRRPAATSTLVTMAPALSLLLLPTTLAVVDDATNRWWFGQAPGTAYQVRVVALFVVAAALVAVGAWRRWLGVLLPAAAALLVVTATQLVELGRFLPQWVSFAVAGGVLVVAGARWEAVRALGREGSAWARRLR